MKRELEIAILSNIRLGTSESRARELAQYLEGIQTDILVISGPFYNRPFQPKKKLPASHEQVLHSIIEKAVDKTKVYLVSQRSESSFPLFSGKQASNIQFREKLEFHYNKKKYLILPDTNRRPTGRYRPFSRNANNWSLRVKQWLYDWQKFLYQAPDNNPHLHNNQPKLLGNKTIHNAIDQGYDLLVCGHSYAPIIAQLSFETQDITYMNTGDWNLHRTALEYRWNKWSIHQYHELDYGCISPRLQVRKPPEGQTRPIPSMLLRPQQLPDSASE